MSASSREVSDNCFSSCRSFTHILFLLLLCASVRALELSAQRFPLVSLTFFRIHDFPEVWSKLLKVGYIGDYIYRGVLSGLGGYQEFRPYTLSPVLGVM